MNDLLPGDPQRVGPYEILRRLAAGGMGQVFLGRSPGGKLVALKVIRAEFAEDAEFRARFRREAAAMKSVSGAYTAPVIDADVDGDLAWLATSFIDAPSLAGVVQERGPLPLQEILGLAAGLAEALWAIHRESLTHRDLKPANVLLAPDGPRVIDFGLAVTADNSALTRTGMVVGTPSYMAPEQISGQGATPASDVFALGAVLAFAATGRAPYGSGSTAELVYRIVHGEPDLTGITGHLLESIEACLAKDPSRRPTPSELLGMLNGGPRSVLPTPAAAPTATATATAPPPATGTAIPAPPPAPTMSSPSMPVPGTGLSTRAKTAIGGGALAVVAAIVIAMNAASDPSHGTGSSAGAGTTGAATIAATGATTSAMKTPVAPHTPVLPSAVEGSPLRASTAAGDLPNTAAHMREAGWLDGQEGYYGSGPGDSFGQHESPSNWLYSIGVGSMSDALMAKTETLLTGPHYKQVAATIPGSVYCEAVNTKFELGCTWVEGPYTIDVTGAEDGSNPTFTETQLVAVIERIYNGTEH